MKIEKEAWDNLSYHAWQVRDNAHIFGNTRVGAAVLTESDKIYAGCNIEHIFRSHDIHAEINVISTMIAQGEKLFKVILIVAERHQFTPCGSCMDWIMQHGGESCIVAYQNSKDGEIFKFTAKELMPHYPH